MTGFATCLKSSMDKAIKDLATSASLDYIDLDGTPLNSEKLLQAKNAIAWTHTSYDPDLFAPFFNFVFEVGAVTANDPSQYTSMSVVDLILGRFGPTHTVDIYDYTGANAPVGAKLGDLFITDADVQGLLSDVAEGLRSVTVTARGVHYK